MLVTILKTEERDMNNNSKIKTGFTLVELVVTICIASVLLGIAVPSFIGIIKSYNVTTITNRMVSAINLARSEAIKRGVQVTINNLGIGSSIWEGGWQVFVDNNGDGTLNGTDLLLKTYPALTNKYTLRTGANYTCWLAYTSTGLSKGSGSACSGGLSNDTFRVCDPSASTTLSRSITINMVGRPSPSTGTASCP